VSELRQDPVTGRWVVIATERAKRPESFSQRHEKLVRTKAICPFCYGSEDMTPPEVLAFRPESGKPNTSGWKVRVVPNKFPAFTMGNKSEVSMLGMQENLGIYLRMQGLGVHEVIVNSPDHFKSLALLTEDEVGLVIDAYRSRLLDIKNNPGVEYVLIIVNHGKEAGASIEHSHSQLFGTPIIPPLITEELNGSRSYFHEKGRCVFCDILSEELGLNERIILESENFLVFSPYAARQPFETWIIPKRHSANFESISSIEKKDFAFVLKNTLLKIYDGLNDSPYNFYLHTSPYKVDTGKFYHWHLEIFPKLSIQAGFEMGSGTMINVAFPEESAKFLRNF